MPLAGKGERFRRCAYDQPKPLVNVLGRPLVLRVIESLGLSATDSLIIVYHNSLRETCLESLIRQAFPHFQISFRCLANRTRGAPETVLFGLDTLPDDALDAPIIILRAGVCDEPSAILSCPGGTDTVDVNIPRGVPAGVAFSVQAIVSVPSGPALPAFSFTRPITFTVL